MTPAAWFLLGAALAFLGLFAVVHAEVHHLYAERDHLRRDLRVVRGQRDIADSERAGMQARLDAKVSPFGPVQGLPMIPEQRRPGSAS